MLTLFSFGYEGWGPHVPELLRTFDEVEGARGFGPPRIVDTRIRRQVRAVGFRNDAPERLMGERYRWMKRLGNRRILTGKDGIEIDDPSAAADLLDLAIASAAEGRRIIFFCSCGPVEGCHRQEVARLVVAEANGRGLDVRVVEWPGGEPMAARVTVPRDILQKVRRGRVSVPLDSPTTAQLGLPWFSTMVLSTGDDELSILAGPAKYSGGWFLPVLEAAIADEEAEGLQRLGRERRSQEGYDSRISSPRRYAKSRREPFEYCIYHIEGPATLTEIARNGGSGELTSAKSWRAGPGYLGRARSTGKELLILLDHADIFRGICWEGVVEGIEIVQDGENWSSRVSVTGLTEIPEKERFPVSALRLVSTGQRIAADYQKGYALCHTPSRPWALG